MTDDMKTELTTDEFDTRGDNVNERLMAAIKTITEIFATEGGYIRPFEAAQMVRPFVEAVNLVTVNDPDFLREELTDFRELDDEAVGELLMAMPITEKDAHFDDLNQHLAVDVARVLGPDNAQNWYRFAVLVTKLA